MQRFLYVMCLIILFVPWLGAQTRSAGKAPLPGKTVYDFTEVDIMGKLKKPEGQAILERPDTDFRRLFDLDESFLPNITRSVDDF